MQNFQKPDVVRASMLAQIFHESHICCGRTARPLTRLKYYEVILRLIALYSPSFHLFISSFIHIGISTYSALHIVNYRAMASHMTRGVS